MPLMDTADYRSQLRKWLTDNTAGLDSNSLDRTHRLALRQRLFDARLAAPAWPVEYGGLGLDTAHQRIFNEETAPYSSYFPNMVVTLGICAPLLLEQGTEQHKRTHLPRMLRGDETWTQLLSEPDAGSDLAAVKTRAEPASEGWVLNGQKVWTSEAHIADYALALVRTGSGLRDRSALSMLIIDMRSEGIDIRPLREMTGESVFNEVFLDQVQVAGDCLLGKAQEGWSLLLRMLHHERVALGAGTTGGRTDSGTFDRLVDTARRTGSLELPEVRRALIDTWIEEQVMDRLGDRIRAVEQAGLSPGPIGSIAKIGVAQAARVAAEAGMTVGGMAATAWSNDDPSSDRAAHDLLFSPMTAIAGGTTEIQKNTVAERLLALPREQTLNRRNEGA